MRRNQIFVMLFAVFAGVSLSACDDGPAAPITIEKTDTLQVIGQIGAKVMVNYTPQCIYLAGDDQVYISHVVWGKFEPSPKDSLLVSVSDTTILRIKRVSSQSQPVQW